MTNLQEHTRHLDLFSGIGGFALAADRVWGNVEHIFVEIDPFCQKVLRKHWKESKIYDDIRTVTYADWSGSGASTSGTDTNRQTLHERQEKQSQSRIGRQTDLLTGGFPCQPFSQAGKRGGTADNRYLWPEMLRIISEFKPTWVIAENVRGLLTWNEGLVFEQVCTDLEREGYEVQPFIIPACGVNAPHRRERVWFVANCKSARARSDNSRLWDKSFGGGGEQKTIETQSDSHAPNPRCRNGSERSESLQSTGQKCQHEDGECSCDRYSWEQNWTQVAAELCRVDDGISPGLDEFAGYTKARHRQERLKALGNAIVPQVAEQIMRGMV